MSKAIETVKVIDESVTNILTKFCWWTDVHFGKDNVWWTITTFVVIFPLLETIQFYIYEKGVNIEDSFIFFVALFFAVWALFSLLVVYFPPIKQVLLNAKKSPNKNKTDNVLSAYKISTLVTSLLLWAFPSLYFFASVGVKGFDYAAFISVELILYFLSTEPIPPAVKRRKLEEKELKRLQFAHQKN